MNEDPIEKVPSDKDENNNDKSENLPSPSDSVINTPKKKQLIRIKNTTGEPTKIPSDNVVNIPKKKLRIKSIDGKPVNPHDNDNRDTDTDSPKGRLLMVKEDDTINSYFKKYLDEHPDFFDDGAILEKQLQDDGMTVEIINDMFKTIPKHLIIDAIDRGVETSLQNWETKMKARRERLNRNNNNDNTPK